MRMLTTGLIAFTLAVGFGASTPATAQEYPWCAHYGQWGTMGTNCGFRTLAQCQATVSGIGGYCQQNPRYAQARDQRRPPRSDRHYR